MQKTVFRSIVTSVLAAVIAFEVFTFPTSVLAKSKNVFRLSKKSMSISNNTNVSLISGRKNDKIQITVQKPDIVAVSQKSQKGKKTTFTVSPKMRGSTKVVFTSGKRKATLKVTVKNTSFDTIRNGFTAQLFTGTLSPTGTVWLNVQNHTGMTAYLADSLKIHGDLEYDGHWFNPSNDSSAQFAVQYATVGPNEDRQIQYYNAQVWGQRDDALYKIMTFRNQASVTTTIYFGETTAENAYTVTIDTNGVTSIVKQ